MRSHQLKPRNPPPHSSCSSKLPQVWSFCRRTSHGRFGGPAPFAPASGARGAPRSRLCLSGKVQGGVDRCGVARKINLARHGPDEPRRRGAGPTDPARAGWVSRAGAAGVAGGEFRRHMLFCPRPRRQVGGGTEATTILADPRRPFRGGVRGGASSGTGTGMPPPSPGSACGTGRCGVHFSIHAHRHLANGL